MWQHHAIRTVKCKPVNISADSRKKTMERSPGGEQVDKKPTLAADGTVVPTPASTDATSTVSSEPLYNLYDIIRCVEKDPLDNTAKQRESAEASQKILELQKSFEAARAQIRQLPGIDFNKDEQLQQLEQLRSQLRSKQNLLLKYKDMQF